MLNLNEMLHHYVWITKNLLVVFICCCSNHVQIVMVSCKSKYLCDISIIPSVVVELESAQILTLESKTILKC